ncbi:MAG TPA: RHS repeat domain-containing protein [Puia sp.]|nr:RHS repeat domain-containing protein [Puia sp.]
MRINTYIFLLFTLVPSVLRAQVEDRKLFTTPTAASLSRFGEIPVDYFTGIPDIDIPLYNFKSRDISVPIHLAYHAAGIRPSDIASWVGLGWTLQSGGAITRIQNDLPDELYDFFSGTGIGDPRGFFYNYGHLAASGWNGADSLYQADEYKRDEMTAPTSTFAHTTVDYAPDEFEFNFLGMSGSLIMGQDGNWHLKSKQGLNFAVTTEIGAFAVWEPNKSGITGTNYPSLIHKCLSKFTLTAADGVQYIFGSDTASNIHNFVGSYIYGFFSTPDSNAVEFTRVGAGYSNTPDADCRDGGTVPVTWYLTKIKSPSGDSVTFQYTRDGYQMKDNTVALGTFSECSACEPYQSFTYGAGDNITILDGSTLAGITGASGSIQFHKSKANELDWTPLGNSESPQNLAWSNGNGLGLFYAYADEVFQGTEEPYAPTSTYMELDSMQINDPTGNKVRSFNFSYTSGSTQRLFLNSVLEKGGDGSSLMPYSFTYNNINGLNQVPYNTLSVDPWGYYTNFYSFNGLFYGVYAPSSWNPFLGSGSTTYETETSNIEVDSLAYVFNGAFNAQYLANRKPVPATMQYGVLTQITYPTGGNTQFTWEPNTYSKFLQVGTIGLTLSVTDMDSTVTGGGLRIQQITSQANFNSPPITKTYKYVRNYLQGNNVTSGVLNSGLPLYVDSLNSAGLIYRDWSSDDVLPTHYTAGSPVTYTTVTELSSDSSVKVFTYSNQDNGYLDQPPTSIIGSDYTSISTIWEEAFSSSLELQRGLLLNEAWYNSGHTLLKNLAYQYDTIQANTAIHRYQYDKKFILYDAVVAPDDGGSYTVIQGDAIYYGDILTPINIYTEYPYLSEATKTDYDQNGQNPVTVVHNYTYDNYRNKISDAYTSSEGQPVNISYNYAANTISGLSTTAQQGQSAMQTAGMYGIPLEAITTRSGSQTEHTRLDYQTFVNSINLVVPYNSYQASYGQPLDSNVRYINFDSKGNPVEYMARDGITTCTDWDYNQAYPTVRVRGAYNTLRRYTAPSTSSTTGQFIWAAGVFGTQQTNFTSPVAGTISFSGGFGGYPANDTYTFTYTLSGPTNEYGMLCITGSGTGCGSNPSSINFSNMPAGTYTLSVTPSSSYSIGSTFSYSYPITVYLPDSTGSKNYFYDGFENNGNTAVIGGNAHTGKFYWGSSSYTTTFTPPDNNTYTIEWWNLQSGSWVYNTNTYTKGMNLTGPVDDVRIYPSTAQMSTYTYQPMIGLTSSIDPKGFTTYYTYDGFGRLASILDKNGNVLKTYCYNYSGQAQYCPLSGIPQFVAVNATNTTYQTVTITFVNTATSASYAFTLAPNTSSVVLGGVPPATYNVYMSPSLPESDYPILYEIYTSQQTYYAEVEFGSLNVSGNTCPIYIYPN